MYIFSAERSIDFFTAPENNCWESYHTLLHGVISTLRQKK